MIVLSSSKVSGGKGSAHRTRCNGVIASNTYQGTNVTICRRWRTHSVLVKRNATALRRAQVNLAALFAFEAFI